MNDDIIKKISDILLENNIKKFYCVNYNIRFGYNNIIYLIMVEDENTFSFGPVSFTNTDFNEDYLLNNETEYGESIEDVIDYVYFIKHNDYHKNFNKIITDLDKIESKCDEIGLDINEILRNKFDL
jgi:hypothetical protein